MKSPFKSPEPVSVITSPAGIPRSVPEVIVTVAPLSVNPLIAKSSCTVNRPLKLVVPVSKTVAPSVALWEGLFINTLLVREALGAVSPVIFSLPISWALAVLDHLRYTLS